MRTSHVPKSSLHSLEGKNKSVVSKKNNFQKTLKKNHFAAFRVLFLCGYAYSLLSWGALLLHQIESRAGGAENDDILTNFPRNSRANSPAHARASSPSILLLILITSLSLALLMSELRLLLDVRDLQKALGGARTLRFELASL